MAENAVNDTGIKHIWDKGMELIESTQSMSGNPVTITNAAPINAEDITVDITPKQDLHGYDRPWAGGAGKNKLPLTLSNLKTWNTEGTWSGNTYTSGGISFTFYTSDDDAVVRIHAEGTSPGWLSLFKNGTLDIGHATILSGCPAGGGSMSYVLAGYLGNPYRLYEDNGNGIDISQDIDFEHVYIDIKTGYAMPSGGIDFYPMIRLATETDATFAPYSNICPPEGRTGAELTQKDAATNPTVTRIYTASFGETVYGGKWHVTAGGTDKTHANIANYNGETINEPWLSSLDEYSPGATPTIGAQVVYPLTTPTIISTPKQNVPMLQGVNTVSADCGDVSLRYQPDNVIGELKGEIEAVEAELAEAEENLKIVYEDYIANTSMGIVVQNQAVGDTVFSDALDITKTGYTPIAVTDTSVVLSTVADQGKIATHCLLDVNNNRVRFYVHCMDSAASVAIPPNSLTFRVAYKKA